MEIILYSIGFFVCGLLAWRVIGSNKREVESAFFKRIHKGLDEVTKEDNNFITFVRNSNLLEDNKAQYESLAIMYRRGYADALLTVMDSSHTKGLQSIKDVYKIAKDTAISLNKNV